MVTPDPGEPDGQHAGGREPVFELTGGALCLDFANTISGHRQRSPRERLQTYGDLIAWAEQTGILGAADARRLRTEGTRRPGDAAAVLARARTLREAIYGLATALPDSPADADLAALNGELASAMRHARLESGADRLEWAWEKAPTALDRVLWPVARSAADLFTSDEPVLVRECASETCTWLFRDTSKNHSRKWCDMRDCGNRAKVRRHRARQRAGDPESEWHST